MKKDYVLIVDDDKIALTINEIILRRMLPDGQIVAIQNINQAFDILEGECDWPSIILLDVNMPTMDGWEFLDRIEDQLAVYGKDTMICMLSSSNHPNDLSEFNKRNYVKSFFQKPLQVKQLQGAIDQLYTDTNR